jgi:short-subunit dehydrogenase
MERENGRVVVITGASSGIGADLARQLGERNYRLVLAARRADALRRVAAEAGCESITVETDVTRRADMERLREAAIDAFGAIDVWINNAGRGINRPVLELSDEEVDDMLDVNLRSVIYGMQAIAPYFRERGRGHIINVSSFLSRVPIATFRSVYSAAKAAVNSLTANVRVDLARTHPDIDVSLVLPAVVLTEFATSVIGAPPSTQPPPNSPLRPQTVEEVAAVMVDLIDNPVPEVYTNPLSHDIVRRYFDDVGAFESAFRSPEPVRAD